MPSHQKTKKASSNGKFSFLFILVAIVAIGSGLLVQNSKSVPVESPEFKKLILLPNAKPLIDVNFVDHNRKSFSTEQLVGKWSILFFGFTNCPDVCPTTMQTLKQVKSKLEQTGKWHNYQVVMVSVDPERDTPERLSKYVPFFDPEFIGISGPLKSTESFAKNVGILFFKSSESANGGYDVDHGAALILINPEGQYAGVITAPHIESTISEDLGRLADYAGVKATSASISNNDERQTPSNANKATSAALNSQNLRFENAWIRPAPPGVTSMAAYVDLVNTTNQDIVIDQSSSPAFGMTMIHTTSIEDGIASMEHLNELVVPANGKVSLAPLGIHMMLLQPKENLDLGDDAELVLIGENGVKYSHAFSVKPQPEQ